MDKLEEIKTRYMLFEAQHRPKTLDEAQELISFYVDDMEESCSSMKTALRENKIDKIKACFVMMFYDLIGFEYVDSDFFDRDNDILREHQKLAMAYEKMFQRLGGALTSDNLQTVCALAEFTHQNYLSNYNYLEELRDGLNYEYMSGIVFYGSEERSDVSFAEFFEEEFQNITKIGKTKVKKEETSL